MQAVAYALYLFASLSVFAEPSKPIDFVPAKTLTNEIEAKLEKVDEFRFIRELGEKYGVRVYLFGGTAAGFAHYVKWNYLRTQGDNRFQPDRFDFDYSNIYRSTQDLDLVVDASPEIAKAIASKLQAKYPHTQGSKSAWEVRTLRTAIDSKMPILDSPEFLNQHSDSHSTGLIEVTKPRNNEPLVRDIRDWKSTTAQFLEDVRTGQLHYYFSNEHAETERAKKGLNPEIFSVVRYLTKAFQYELSMRPEDLEMVRRVIARFDPKKDLATEYARNWLEKNGKKLFQHAVNLDFAYETLNSLGLRVILRDIKRDIGTKDSLAWWMNKMPLRAQSVGGGSGRTAREVGLDVVAHETSDFLAYESITRDHTGNPNVFVSRKSTPHETAAFGDGFYTKVGTSGARGTHFTIRFKINPNAKEGTDFFLANNGEFVVLLNKNAAKVIPESLNFTPVDYFRFRILNAERLKDELGVWNKLERRANNKFSSLSEREVDEIRQLLKEHRHSKNLDWKTWSDWIEISTKHAHSAKQIIEDFELALGEEKFRAAVESSFHDRVEYFTSLSPTFKEAGQILTRIHSHTLTKKLFDAGLLKSATTPREFIELASYRGADGVEINRYDIELSVVSHLDHFFSLKPTLEDVRLLYNNVIFYKENKAAVYRHYAGTAKTAESLLTIAETSRPAEMNEKSHYAFDRIIIDNLGLFETLQPNPEQRQRVSKIVKTAAGKARLVERYVVPVLKTPAELIDALNFRADQGESGEIDEVMLSSAKRFFELNPTVDETVEFSKNILFHGNIGKYLEMALPLAKTSRDFILLTQMNDFNSPKGQSARHQAVFNSLAHFFSLNPSASQVVTIAYFVLTDSRERYAIIANGLRQTRSPADFLILARNYGNSSDPYHGQLFDQVVMQSIPHFLSLKPSPSQMRDLIESTGHTFPNIFEIASRLIAHFNSPNEILRVLDSGRIGARQTGVEYHNLIQVAAMRLLELRTNTREAVKLINEKVDREEKRHEMFLNILRMQSTPAGFTRAAKEIAEVAYLKKHITTNQYAIDSDVADSFIDFLKLNPSIHEIETYLHEGVGNSRAELTVRQLLLDRAKTVKEFLHWITFKRKGLESTDYSAADAVILDNLKKFLSLNPRARQIRELFESAHHRAFVFQRGFPEVMNHIRTARDFLTIANVNRVRLSSDDNSSIDRAIYVQTSRFIGLKPSSVEQRVFVERRLGSVEEKSLVLKMLLAEVKSAEDFLAVAKNGRHFGDNDINQKMDFTVFHSLSRFFSYNPTDAQVSRLFSEVFRSDATSRIVAAQIFEKADPDRLIALIDTVFSNFSASNRVYLSNVLRKQAARFLASETSAEKIIAFASRIEKMDKRSEFLIEAIKSVSEPTTLIRISQSFAELLPVNEIQQEVVESALTHLRSIIAKLPESPERERLKLALEKVDPSRASTSPTGCLLALERLLPSNNHSVLSVQNTLPEIPTR